MKCWRSQLNQAQHQRKWRMIMAVNSNLSNWKEAGKKIRYCRGHGFESRWSLDFFFQASSFQLLKIEIYCDDHSSLSCTTAVQIWSVSYILQSHQAQHSFTIIQGVISMFYYTINEIYFLRRLNLHVVQGCFTLWHVASDADCDVLQSDPRRLESWQYLWRIEFIPNAKFFLFLFFNFFIIIIG